MNCCRIFQKIVLMLLIAGFGVSTESAVLAQNNDTVNEVNLDKTISHHEDIIAQYPEEVFIPNILFELAELYVTKAELEFKRHMAVYDEEIKKFEKGESPVEPILPRVSFKNSIEICYKLLEKYPKIEYRDKIIYRLAVCHLDEGNPEKAKDYFQKLVFECASSPKISEAHFRLGEYYFNKRDFPKAIEHYSELLNSWDDPYFNMSLYKLGWAYFNINDYSNAISTYVYLISDIKLLEELNTELLGKTKADVKNEAIEYISHSFCEYGGAAKAKEILKSKSTQEYAILIFEKMGEIYKKRNFYPEAIATYEALLDLYPFYPYAPNIQKQVIECYEKDFQDEKVIEAKETFVKQYGPDSKWLAQYPEGKIRNDALVIVQDMLFSLGTYYQAKAQEKNRNREYLASIEKYDHYLKKFRDSENAHKANYYLAECYYEIGDYAHAADEYFKVMSNYQNEEFKNVAAYNRILSYYQLLKKNVKADSITFYLEDFLGESSTVPVPIKVGHEAQANLIKACNDYVRFLPSDDKMLEVQMKYGEILYELGEWDLAVKVYTKIITDENKNSPFYGSAMNMIAQCHFKMNDYNEAERWFEKLAAVFPDSNKYIEKSKKMIASANYKKAESIAKDGNAAKAAAEFLKLAFSTKDPEIARASIIEAASDFEKAGEMEKSVKCYERMIEEQPDIVFLDELLMKAGLLREKMENWIKATDHYTKLVEENQKSKFAPLALLNLAGCYENLKLWHKANDVYQKYLTLYPLTDPDKYLESQCKRGEILREYMKDDRTALTEFEKTVQKYDEFRARGIVADDYITAKAQYLIAEINFSEYKKIKLVPPLQRSLKQKQESLSKVLKAYIATGKFKVAEWTTASLHKAGLTFEELCDALMTSPLPPELSGEEADQYYENLRQQLVIPFKEKALEFYKSNVATATKNKIQNEWTEESKKRMEALIVELGLGSKKAIDSTSDASTPSSGGGS